MSAYVLGQGAWMVGRPDVAAVLDDRSIPGAEAPDVRAYPSRLMRGTSACTRMAVAVARQALLQSGLDPRTIPAVFGSAFGEIVIAIDQFELMVTGDGQISPMLFKNSVHNTGTGVFSIANENRTPSNSIAAGPWTVASTLLEALCMLDDGAEHVLVVVGDETLPPPLSELARWDAFAAAWVLGRKAPDSAPTRVQLSDLRALPTTPIEVPAALAMHPCACAWGLLDAIHRERPGRVSLGRDADEGWSVMVEIAARG